MPDDAKPIPDKVTPATGYNPYKRSRLGVIVHTIRGDKLLVTMTRSPITNRMYIHEEYVRMNESQIYMAGFKQAFDLKTTWEYMFQRVYVKFVNFYAYDIAHDPEPNYETAATLYDFAQSGTTAKFMKSFTKVASFDGMDTKKLASVAILAVGVLFGFLMIF